MSTALVQFQQVLTEKKGAIASRLPAHLSPDRMVKIALSAAAKNPKILDCSRESVLSSIMLAAELGLEPGGGLGEGYLVPYGTTCQFIPGYRGFISLARRSGQIVSVESHIVYEGDLFEFELGTEQRIRHVPNLDRDPEKPAVMRAVYAVARIVGGGVQSELMTKAEVDAIRRRSKASGSGPWVTDYTEMARKTAIRRLFKYLPVSVELCKAMELQVSAESGVFDDLEAYEDPKTQELNAKAAQAAAERAASEVKP